MKMMAIAVALALGLAVAPSLRVMAGLRTSAIYEVTFESTWSAATHPQDFPPNPHYSPLVGATHHGGVVFWEPGALASAGIKDVAELGNAAQMKAEIHDAMTAGTAADLLSEPGISSPGMARLSFVIHPSHPLVTLVTMVVPSPDWFVGVHGLSLIEAGRWVEAVTVPVFAYDSGTDSGVSYTSPNQVTRPPVPIFAIGDAPFLVDGDIPELGTLTFRRTDLICDVALSQSVYGNGETITIETWRLANLNPDPTQLEIGIWLDLPNAEPVSIIDEVRDVGAESDETQGPLTIQEVTADLPRGTYAVGCRALDPVTKQLRYEDIESFEVQQGGPHGCDNAMPIHHRSARRADPLPRCLTGRSDRSGAWAG